MSRATWLRTLMALGPANLARVGLYRMGLRLGLHPVQRTSGQLPTGPFFATPPTRTGQPDPNRSWDGQLLWYDWKAVSSDGAPPDWFAHPFGTSHPSANLPWWHISDFSEGDIKNLWELSRMGWVVAMATCAAHGHAGSIDRLNAWLSSWASANPAYLGPNWKCGQEAAIRVMHIITAAIVLKQDGSPLPALRGFIEAHLRRIAATLSYAIAQQNNHATSEATAMFIGGTFLAQYGSTQAQKWADIGRRLLESQARRLIEPDGSFSQHSVNYHRLMLDSYCLAEAWRQRRLLPAFSPECRERLFAATGWLDAMVERSTGDAPNIGANDGARLIPLTDTGYRDFRPTLQLASVLFRDSRALPESGPWNAPLRWLDIAMPEETSPPPGSRSFDDGGYHCLRAGGAFAVLRYPRFRFRPSQADALHVDLWADGRNLLRDGGTYSYNDPEGYGALLAGTSAHNTLTFDGRDQMPRLGRFLFGDWLEAAEVKLVRQVEGSSQAAAGYRDNRGVSHHRRVTLKKHQLLCIDRVEGQFEYATLRWRLPPGEYELHGDRLTGEHVELFIAVIDATHSLSLQRVAESRHYQQIVETPCLEVRLTAPCCVTTIVQFGEALRRS